MANMKLLRIALAALTANSVSAWGTGPDPDDVRNWVIIKGLLWCWLAIVGCVVIHSLVLWAVRYIRTVSCLNNNTQRYFARPTYWYGDIKRYFLDAPLFRTRHHREFKLSAAIDVGTLPSRLQTTFLVGYVAAAIAMTCVSIDWSKNRIHIEEQLLKRTGFMAVMNMLPLFLLAGRNNPLILLTGITFDTYNLIHRWLGRIVVAEAIVHGCMWLAEKVEEGGWEAAAVAEKHGSFILSGTIGTCAITAILFQSPSIVRHAFYETFLHTHILLAILALAAVWVHLKDFALMKSFIKGCIAIWAFDRGARILRILYRSGFSTKADIEVLPGDAVKITVKMPRPWKFQPGSHAYVYLPAMSWHMNHPFTVAWSDEQDEIEYEKGLVVSQQDVLQMKKQTMSFIVRRRTGFTEKLYRKADQNSTGRLTTSAFVEGPYGSQSLESYGTVVLFAAGVGITHQVPHVRELVKGYGNGSVATRKVVLVWIIQSPEHLEWIRPWMTTILGLPKRREVLKILLFVTRPKSTKEIHSPSSSVQMFPGKPNIQALIDQEVEQSIGAIGVTVCGVGALADDVRRASRMWMGKVNIDFVEESFSW
ncbi:hypothetical protein EJ08DRAFT_695889 [Tothia fuscella]|uniref:ferric-chelate reductase (NADPH) n=1 Tax=Tothia fuscella TaxID=1048955 RepID=A0A9P4NUU9_9PEZI|nr:hypothetical protein EJ08DRAFT_695889 [Tothia fuscella]